jgi:hypothetical protein
MMLLQPQTDLLRPQLIGHPSILRPQILEPSGSQWGLTFNGTQYIDCGLGLNITTENFTIIAQIKTSATAARTQIISNREAGSPFTGYYISVETDNRLLFQINDKANFHVYDSGTIGVVDGLLHEIALVVDRGNNLAYLYVDRIIDSITNISAVVGTISSSQSLWIGSDAAAAFPFDGLIKKVTIYNRAFSATEIIRTYEHPQILPDMRNLIGWWRFQEGFGVANGTVIRDWSNQGNHGSMQNFSGNPWVNVGIR